MPKPLYLACIWCGGDIPKSKPYAKYCGEKCGKEAAGRNVIKSYMPKPKSKVITIEVYGGVVVAVSGLPSGWQYKIKDRDDAGYLLASKTQSA